MLSDKQRGSRPIRQSAVLGRKSGVSGPVASRISQRRRTVILRANPNIAAVRAKSDDEKARMLQATVRGWLVRSKMPALTSLDGVFKLCGKEDALHLLAQNVAEYPDFMMLQNAFGITAAKMYKNYEFRNQKRARLQLILMRHFRRNMWGNAPESLALASTLGQVGVGDVGDAVVMRSVCAQQGWNRMSAIVVDNAACVDTAMLMGFDIIATWADARDLDTIEEYMASMPQLCMDHNLLSVVVVTTGPMLDMLLSATNTVLDHHPRCGDMIERLSCTVRIPNDSPASWHTAAKGQWSVGHHARCDALRQESKVDSEVVEQWHACDTSDVWNCMAGSPLVVDNMLEKLRAESDIRCLRLQEKDKTWLQGNDFKMLKILFQETSRKSTCARILPGTHAARTTVSFV